MSVAGILSSLSQFQLGGPTAAKQGIQQLGQALRSGNLTAAQSDFAALQQAFAQAAIKTATTSATNPATTTSHIKQSFKQLDSDLQSGNISASQKDLANLQQDIQSASGTGSAGNLTHRLNGGSVSGASSGINSSGINCSRSTAENTMFQNLSQLAQELASGNLSSAQQAYATLQSQPPDVFGGGQLQAESPVSMLA